MTITESIETFNAVNPVTICIASLFIQDTKALIEEDVREDTFVITKAVTDGLLLLKKNGVLLITGHAGTGKSRISRHIVHMFCTENKSHKSIKLNTLKEWEDVVNRRDYVVVLFDDIFGETNCIYNREIDTPTLDKVYAFVCKGNIKVIITIRDTVKRNCQEALERNRLLKFDFIDLSLDKPTEAILDEMNEIRRNGETHRNDTKLYAVMAYTAINEDGIDPNDDSNITEIQNTIYAIYGKTIELKKAKYQMQLRSLKEVI
ncbi:unnamed protein product [Mytilus coruscus]|uniref:Novel STAND NTPase 3 domain-containing protein n=1 Tax=Mytilus coruscus TaxID=42192 RepID=A0A6J8F1G4_MYTCO|nr:unnamed protein product [Mytilus coruscus]